MSLDIQGYSADPVAMKCGKAVEIGRNKDGTMRTIWVRPFGSAYETRLAALRKAAGEQLCRRDPELDKEQQLRAMAELILCRRDENGNELPAWINFQTAAGEQIPPTLENKINHLRGGAKGDDPDTFVRQLFIDTATCAGELSTFAKEDHEAAVENLSST